MNIHAPEIIIISFIAYLNVECVEKSVVRNSHVVMSFDQ